MPTMPATSSGQDVRDVFAEKLCNRNGSKPTRASTHYLYKGRCRALKNFNAGELGGKALRYRVSVHGPIIGTATVHGKPYALSRKRSTFGRDGLNLAALLIGTIGGIGIANTLTLNVLERRREIGVMRSLGGRNSHLIQVCLTKALLMGGMALVHGLVLGYPLARFLLSVMSAVLFPLEFSFPGEMVVLAMGFTLLLTGLASVGPALGAARLKVSYALRYE